MVAAGSTTTAAQVLDPRTGDVLVEMRGPVAANLAVGGGRVATVGLQTFDVQVWDAGGGRLISRPAAGNARAVSLSPTASA